MHLKSQLHIPYPAHECCPISMLAFYFILFYSFYRNTARNIFYIYLFLVCKCKFSSLICITAMYMSLNSIHIDIKRNYDYLRLDLAPNVIKTSLCSDFMFIGKS